MGQLVEEVKIWNTPLIGAYMLWRFTQGYSKSHPNGDAPLAILHFIACAILTNEKLLSLISNKRPNLQSFIRSFEENKDSDLLLSIQERTRSKFRYCLDSLDIGIAEGLFIWDTETGKVFDKEMTVIPKKGSNLKSIHNSNGLKAEILGKWFSGHDISTITSYLKLVL